MLLSDIFDTLAYGELSALALASGGEIAREDMPKLVNHINRGVLELHKRFSLKRDTFTFTTEVGVLRYQLDKLCPNIIEVLRVFGHSEHPPKDEEIVKVSHFKYMNPEIPLCYLMVSPTIIRFNKTANVLTDFTVEYKATPARIKVDDFDTFDPTKVEVDLPMTHLEALSLFIASRVIAPIANNLGSPQENMNYQAMYEQACQALTVQGLDVEEVAYDQDRFYRNGFA